MKSKSRRYRRGRNAEAEAQYDLNSKNYSDPVGWRLKTFSFLRHSQMYVLTNTRTRIKVCSSLKRCILGFSPFLRMNVLLPIHTNVAWENSQHLATLPLVSPANDVWETSAEIPYWWHVTTQDLGSASDWSCRVGNWLQPIRKYYPDLFSDTSSVLNRISALVSILRRHFAGKPEVASWNVGCFLNLVPRVLSYPPYGAGERETVDQRFPGSLSLSLRRAGRREPWERGCCFLRLRLTLLNIFLEFTFRVILKKKKGFSPVWLTWITQLVQP